MTIRTFDYRPRLDERNRAHRITGLRYLPTDIMQRSRYWVPGVVLDQGSEGACVGYGCTAEAIASPARSRFTIPPNDVARALYHQAQGLDAWPGEDYEGTSVLAGMKAGQQIGWWTGYRWAFNLTELRAALEEGPVVLGVDWYSGMYEAPRGRLAVSGTFVGGHCILATGYSPAYGYRLRNSWSKEWGANGSAYISANDLDRILFQAGGEAAVPIGRVA